MSCNTNTASSAPVLGASYLQMLKSLYLNLGRKVGVHYASEHGTSYKRTLQGMSDLCLRLSCVDLVLCRAEGGISWRLKVGASNGGWGGSTQSLHQGLKFKKRL